VCGAEPFLYLAGCNMSFRRTALRRAGAFNPELPYCYDDAELCMRLIDARGRIAWVEGALVRHERAASAVRDGEQVFTDPYSAMFCSAVFIEQSRPTSAPDVLAVLAVGWKSGPAELVPEERRGWFRERVETGLTCAGAGGTSVPARSGAAPANSSGAPPSGCARLPGECCR
jgi:hypothetical protein